MLQLGFDVGGTKCAAVLGSMRTGVVELLDRRAFPTPPDWHEAVEAMFTAGEEMLAGQRPDAVGFSCGGPLDAEKGIVLSPPNLPGWDRVPLTRMARERFSARAFLENDANACALAEWRWGAGRGTRDMAFLTFGTGLGAGLIAGGRLIRGANGNAGELGHIRLSEFGPAGYGKAGSFEGFCSGGGIAQLAETMGRGALQQGKRPAYLVSGEPVTAKSVAEAARSGDETARAVYAECGRRLGQGLSLLVDLMNPECIVIGSIYARCEDLLREEMLRVMERECLSLSYRATRVVPASLGEDIGSYAALGVADYGINC